MLIFESRTTRPFKIQLFHEDTATTSKVMGSGRVLPKKAKNFIHLRTCFMSDISQAYEGPCLRYFQQSKYIIRAFENCVFYYNIKSDLRVWTSQGNSSSLRDGVRNLNTRQHCLQCLRRIQAEMLALLETTPARAFKIKSFYKDIAIFSIVMGSGKRFQKTPKIWPICAHVSIFPYLQ